MVDLAVRVERQLNPLLSSSSISPSHILPSSSLPSIFLFQSPLIIPSSSFFSSFLSFLLTLLTASSSTVSSSLFPTCPPHLIFPFYSIFLFPIPPPHFPLLDLPILYPLLMNHHPVASSWLPAVPPPPSGWEISVFLTLT